MDAGRILSDSLAGTPFPVFGNGATTGDLIRLLRCCAGQSLVADVASLAGGVTTSSAPSGHLPLKGKAVVGNAGYFPLKGNVVKLAEKSPSPPLWGTSPPHGGEASRATNEACSWLAPVRGRAGAQRLRGGIPYVDDIALKGKAIYRLPQGKETRPSIPWINGDGWADSAVSNL